MTKHAKFAMPVLAVVASVTMGLWRSSPAMAEDPLQAIVKIGQECPEFSALNTDGQEVSLTGLKGKVILLNFFATWCPPCRRELPQLEAEWNRLKDKGLVVLAVGREHDVAELKEFKSAEHFNMPFVADPKRQVYGKFAKKVIPRNFVISKSGKVVYAGTGYRPDEFASMFKLIEKELEQSG